MYDESWYNAFTQKTSWQPESQKKTHRRRPTLLQQPSEEALPENEVANQPDLSTALDPPVEICPPQATVARRAKSYSDFYDIVRAHLKKEKEDEKRKLRQALKTDIDFERWYSGIMPSIEKKSFPQYQLYLDQLRLAESHLEYLASQTTSSLDLLRQLSSSFSSVEKQTSAFRKQCEGLLSEQKSNLQLADQIAENLEYYTYLEPITRRLNAPGAANRVRQKEFSDMLGDLDRCIEYMQSHPNQKEASTYGSRYKQLLTRALTLIRVHFTNSLREIAADVSKRIADRQLNDTTMSALLYAKFRVGAPDLRKVGLEIQKRAILPKDAAPDAEPEYQSLMNEMFQSYSTTRGRLILPIVSKKMSEIAMAPSTAKDLVTFSRSSISYIRGICMDEYDLWQEWFDSDHALYDFLDAMCEPMYDHLRPRIIHETQILKLCELCTLIQSRYMEEDEDDLQSPISARLDFASLIHPALEDAQTRLVFLAMGILRTDIEHFKPKPEDLDYPARNRIRASATNGNKAPALSGRREAKDPSKPAETPTIGEEDGIESTLKFEPSSKDWYPTLRRAIWLLGRIYRLVNSTVFDDLAHQILHQTTHSILRASNLIIPRSSPTDANLFTIKHLLLLKQHIAAFDLETGFAQAPPEVNFDFSGLTSTFWGSDWLSMPGKLVRAVMAGQLGRLMPRVVRDYHDAKGEVDEALRVAIGAFVESIAGRMTGPIREGGRTVEPPVSAKPAKSNSAKAKDDAANGQNGHVEANSGTSETARVKAAVAQGVPFLRQKLDEYIGDVRTKEMLVAAVMEQVTTTYEAFWGSHSRRGNAGTGAAESTGAGTKGKRREDENWEPAAFAEWCEGVFMVGRSVFGFEDEDDGRSSGELSRDGSI
ncbi:Sec34-domain-containing protein [Eremomyces bilateralis CBS 781.70]|uniref:Conserved oligomeric Golgi complex subunit 3 n=1 Tax=Eremomyces bilateralis CBS 781.70 TaxID=1392243 RepID=A0A6G1G009_9PEZI|nr:Sec34-domain-containing protein [Eremomyces bilateralis CBS 781.70]KAF1811312.1 Sec34-domain-containing protein [Eremomyces bilateralis CBS 781.70]